MNSKYFYQTLLAIAFFLIGINSFSQKSESGESMAKLIKTNAVPGLKYAPQSATKSSSATPNNLSLLETSGQSVGKLLITNSLPYINYTKGNGAAITNNKSAANTSSTTKKEGKLPSENAAIKPAIVDAKAAAVQLPTQDNVTTKQ